MNWRRFEQDLALRHDWAGGAEADCRDGRQVAGCGYRRPSAVSSAAANDRFQTRRSEPRTGSRPIAEMRMACWRRPKA